MAPNGPPTVAQRLAALVTRGPRIDLLPNVADPARLSITASVAIRYAL